MMTNKEMFERWAGNLEKNARLIECTRNGVIDSPFIDGERIKLLLVRLDFIIENLESLAYLMRLEAVKSNRQNR